jgi:hypothetical protein
MLNVLLRMAKAYRQNFIDGQSLSTTSKEFSNKLFSGWDFAILGENARKRKQIAMTVDLKVKHLDSGVANLFGERAKLSGKRL